MKHLVEPIRSLEEVKAIENYLSTNPRNHLLFVLGTNSGLRISDILALNVGDVKGKSHIELKEKKTNKFKKFPINSKLKRLISEFVKGKDPESPLFYSRKHCRLCSVQVYRILKDACVRVGINYNVGTHSMRKTFGYHHYKKFNNVAMLQCILNHSHPQVTLRYIGISQDEIDQSYEQFEL